MLKIKPHILAIFFYYDPFTISFYFLLIVFGLHCYNVIIIIMCVTRKSLQTALHNLVTVHAEMCATMTEIMVSQSRIFCHVQCTHCEEIGFHSVLWRFSESENLWHFNCKLLNFVSFKIATVKTVSQFCRMCERNKYRCMLKFVCLQYWLPNLVTAVDYFIWYLMFLTSSVVM